MSMGTEKINQNLYPISDYQTLQRTKRTYGEYAKSVKSKLEISEVRDTFFESYINQIGAYRAMLTAHQHSAVYGEGDHIMNNEQLTGKIHEIDKTVGIIATKVDYISSGIDEIKNTLKSIEQRIGQDIVKVEQTVEKLSEKVDKCVTKDDLKEQTDRGRFTITTWVALFAAAAAAAAVIVPLVTK